MSEMIENKLSALQKETDVVRNADYICFNRLILI
jgi:hypothetical protein